MDLPVELCCEYLLSRETNGKESVEEELEVDVVGVEWRKKMEREMGEEEKMAVEVVEKEAEEAAKREVEEDVYKEVEEVQEKEAGG